MQKKHTYKQAYLNRFSRICTVHNTNSNNNNNNKTWNNINIQQQRNIKEVPAK